MQKYLETDEKKVDHLIKSHEHELLVASLKERQTICQDTIKVIEETLNNLNMCT